MRASKGPRVQDKRTLLEKLLGRVEGDDAGDEGDPAVERTETDG
jgi:hypothetical protein